MEWVGQQFIRLAAEIERYLKAEQRKTPVQNRQADGETILFEIPNFALPPMEIALIVGDCVHNLRAALDHLAYQLVLANGGEPSERTQFPIHDDRLNKHGHVRTIAVDGGVEPKALAVIESLQPYQSRERAKKHPLAVLQHLSNIDKHRHLHVAQGELTPVRITLTHPTRPPFTLPAVDPPVVTPDNTLIVGALRIPPGRLVPPEVSVEFSATFYVAIRDVVDSDEPILTILQRILDFEREVVLPAFKPFLDKQL